MEKDNPGDTFLKKLEEIQASKASKPDPLWEASGEYDRVYEKQLIEAERVFLSSEPAASIVGIVEEAARAIEKKENLPGIGYYGPKPELKREVRFNVEFLGYHGDDCYPKWQDEAAFAIAVKNGKQISELIKGFRLKYQHVTIRLSIETIKDDKEGLSINWWIGGTNGTIQIENSDYLPLAELLADKIANKGYHDFRPVDSGLPSGWSMN